jgi:hypothetical protein
MGKKRCSFVKKGKKTCQNPVINGFNFCKLHIYKIDTIIKYRVPDHILLEPSGNGQGFIFDSHLGHFYHFNSAGIYIFSMMKENKLTSNITKAVSKRYGEDPAKILSDLRNFYDNLMDLGLIVPYEES